MRGLEAAVISFLALIIIQGAAFHWIKITRRSVVLFGGWALGILLYGLLFWGFPDDSVLWPPEWAVPSDTVTFVNGLLHYWFFFMCYAVFYYMAESSVGVRTMIELASAPEHGLTLEELTRRYRYDWMLNRRLTRMVHAGYLDEVNGEYRTTARGRIVALVIGGCKRFLRLGPGG